MAIHLVLLGVVILVPRDDHEGVGGKLVEARAQELVEPLASEADVGVVGIVVDVGGEHSVVGERSSRKIVVKRAKTDNVGTTRRIVADVVEGNERVVLAVVRPITLVSVAVTRERFHVPAHPHFYMSMLLTGAAI